MPERSLWIGVLIQALTDWEDFNRTGRPRLGAGNTKYNKQVAIERLRWFFFEPEEEEHNLQWIAANVARDKAAMINAVSYVLENGIKLKQLHTVNWDNKRYNKNLRVHKH